MEDKCNNHILFSIPIFVTIVKKSSNNSSPALYQSYVGFIILWVNIDIPYSDDAQKRLLDSSGRDRIVGGFTTTSAISTYHH
jgi:hypothetical protein